MNWGSKYAFGNIEHRADCIPPNHIAETLNYWPGLHIISSEYFLANESSKSVDMPLLNYMFFIKFVISATVVHLDAYNKVEKSHAIDINTT